MAADQLNDKENQFRIRARRRLIGAIALVLLMVTVLPMVLDDRSSQKSPLPEISISIPSQDGAEFSSKIVPVAPQASSPQTPPVQMASPVEKPQETVPTAQPAIEPKAAEKAKPAEAVKPATPATEAAPKPAAAPQADQKSQAAPGAAPTKGSVSVQIGVFSDAAKVEQMRGKIAEKGIQCYTENMNTPKGVKIRLRCGPYAGKTGAQQALETLKTVGYGGILVTNQ